MEKLENKKQKSRLVITQKMDKNVNIGKLFDQ